MNKNEHRPLISFPDGEVLDDYRGVTMATVVLIPALITNLTPKTRLVDWRYMASARKELGILVCSFGGDEAVVQWVSTLIDRGIDYGYNAYKGQRKIKERLANHPMVWDGWLVSSLTVRCVLFYLSNGESNFDRYCKLFGKYSLEDVELMLERVDMVASDEEVRNIWGLLSSLGK